jgi:hypothetical protein
MKRIALLTLLLALVGTVSGWAQSTGCLQKHPETSATPAGSMQVTLTLAPSTTFDGTTLTEGASTKKPKGKKGVGTSAAGTDQTGTVIVSIDIVFWRNARGGVDYVFDPSAIRFDGMDEGTIDGTSTLQLFDMIGQEIVSQGIRMGLNECSPDCENPSTVTRVFSSSCVERVGSGLKTRFICCNNKSYCERAYTACCPNGVDAPVIKLRSVASGTCSGTKAKCEPACP